MGKALSMARKIMSAALWLVGMAFALPALLFIVAALAIDDRSGLDEYGEF